MNKEQKEELVFRQKFNSFFKETLSPQNFKILVSEFINMYGYAPLFSELLNDYDYYKKYLDECINKKLEMVVIKNYFDKNCITCKNCNKDDKCDNYKFFTRNLKGE